MSYPIKYIKLPSSTCKLSYKKLKSSLAVLFLLISTISAHAGDIKVLNFEEGQNPKNFEKIYFVLSSADIASDPSYNFLTIGANDLELKLRADLCISVSDGSICTSILGVDFKMPVKAVQETMLAVPDSAIKDGVVQLTEFLNEDLSELKRQDYYILIGIGEDSDEIEPLLFSPEFEDKNEDSPLRAYYIKQQYIKDKGTYL